MPHIPKEEIAVLAKRLAAICDDIMNQIRTQPLTGLARQFLVGQLRRQAELLKSIALLLETNHLKDQMGTFMLFRGLMDDFIFLMRYQMQNFDIEVLNKHTGKAIKHELDMIEDSRKINNHFFNGGEEGLATDAYYTQKANEYILDPATDDFYQDKGQRRLKNFPRDSEFIREISAEHLSEYQQEIVKANAHSLILWHIFSKYIHYSHYTFRLHDLEVRKIEIDQLKEALWYCYKSILLISRGLNLAGMPNQFNDFNNSLQTDLVGSIDEP